MRLLLSIFTLGFLSVQIVPVYAAEDVAAEPVASVAAADLARTRERYKGSIYAMIWQHPALEQLRQEMRASAEEDVEAGKPDFRQAIKSVVSAQAILFDDLTADNEGRFSAQIDMGNYADAIWQAMAQESVSIEAPAGADAAIQENDDEHMRAARYGSQIVFANSASLARLPAQASDHDLAGELDISALFELVKRAPDADIIALNKARKTIRSDKVKWQLSLFEDGMREHIHMNYNEARIAGAVDVALFDSLPEKTYAAAACYVDGASYKQELLDLDPEIEADLQPLNDFLQPLGTSAAELIGQMRGTCMIALTPSVPFPALTIVLPRSQDLDAVVAALLKKVQKESPAEGAVVLLPIPNMPVMVQIARNASHWILTSDAIAMQPLLKQQAGGFNEGVLAESVNKLCTPDAIFVGVYDMQGLLTRAMGYAAMLPMRDQEKRVQVSDLITKVQGRIKPGYVEAHWVDNGIEINGEGFFGIGAGLGAFAIPAVLVGESDKDLPIQEGAPEPEVVPAPME